MVDKPLIVLGLDGASHELMEAVMSRVDLPGFERLYGEGRVADLDTVFPPHTAPAWSSFATGKNPGKHGVFEWISVRRDGAVSDREAIDSETFYDILHAEGYNVGIVNLPLSHPPSIPGDVVTGFETKGEQFVFPQQLRDIIDFSDYQLYLSPYQRWQNVEENSLALTRSQIPVVKELFEERDHDFFFYLISATDWLQHGVYDTLMTGEPEESFNTCAELFQEADALLQWFMEKVDNGEANLIVLSDHGFQDFDGAFYVNTWLEEHGFLQRDDNGESQVYQGSDHFLIRLLDKSPFLRRCVLSLMPHIQFLFPSNVYIRLIANLADKIDMETSQVFCPRSESSALYINDDRFNGVVSAEEREQVQQEVIEALQDSGYVEPVRKEDVYTGENMEYAPDILLRQKNHKVQRSLVNHVTEEMDIFNHSPTGVFLAYGANGETLSDAVQMIDITPTILDYYGIEPGETIDGEPLSLFET